MVKSQTVHALMKETTSQLCTSRELAGISGLVSLNSERCNQLWVISAIARWSMFLFLWTLEVKPLIWHSDKRLSVLCNVTPSVYSSWPLLLKPLPCSASAPTTLESPGGRTLPLVATNGQWAAVHSHLASVLQHRRRPDAGERHYAAKWVWLKENKWKNIYIIGYMYKL